MLKLFLTATAAAESSANFKLNFLFLAISRAIPWLWVARRRIVVCETFLFNFKFMQNFHRHFRTIIMKQINFHWKFFIQFEVFSMIFQHKRDAAIREEGKKSEKIIKTTLIKNFFFFFCYLLTCFHFQDEKPLWLSSLKGFNCT